MFGIAVGLCISSLFIYLISLILVLYGITYKRGIWVFRLALALGFTGLVLAIIATAQEPSGQRVIDCILFGIGETGAIWLIWGTNPDPYPKKTSLTNR